MIPDWLIYQSIYTFLVSFVSFLLGVASKTTKVVMKDDDLDRIAKSLAARLSDEPVKLDDSEMDKFARKCAKAWNEIPYDNTPDDELFARIEKLAREIAWEQTDVFAAKVMELADQRRAERERAKAEQAATLEGFQVVESAMPKDGEYKRDDLVEVLVEGEWKPGWYAGYFKNDPDDETPHYVAYIEYQDPDGGTDVVDDYIADRDIRHRQPVTTPATA